MSVEDEAAAFWDFALRLYAKPAVEVDCLALQDRDGVNVNLALLAVWLALRGRAVTAAAAAAAAARVDAWDGAVVTPLRRTRRQIKKATGKLSSIDAAEAAVLRRALLDLELRAERAAQRLALEALDGGWERAEPETAFALNARRLLRLADNDPPELDRLWQDGGEPNYVTGR